MFARKIRAFIAGTIVFAAAASLVSAQVRPIDSSPTHAPQPMITALPLPGASVAPTLMTPRPRVTTPKGRTYPAGAHVPLSMLPRLPMKTGLNTVTPATAARFRPFAATGVTMTVTNGGGCGNVVGALYAIGCTINVKGVNLPNGSYQDYSIAPNATTATTLGAAYTNNTDANHAVALSVNGTYEFGIYDTVNNVWLAVIYVNVGNVTLMRVYQDSYHTQETYQFSATGSSAAYIYMQNVSSSDYYVVYVETTAINPKCVFSAPAQSSYGTGTAALCNPSLSPGAQAPGGSLAVTWPLRASTAPGTYSIVLYDLTAQQRVAQVQVSITGSSGITMTIDQNVTGANTQVPPPSPVPAVLPYSTTILAWNDANEQSVSGVALGTGSMNGDQYIWSMNDPDGLTVAKAGPTAITGTGNQSFTFAGAGLNGPGAYPARIFTGSVYDSTGKFVYASQAFKIVGYNSTTYFNQGSSNTSALTVAQGSNATATMIFQNSSDTNFGTGNGDGFKGLAYTTGKDFTATAGNGYGVEMTLAGKTLAQCVIPAGCSTTVTDSSGYVWNVHDYCSDGVGTATTSECYLVMTPQTGGQQLVVNGTISLPNMKFYNATGSSCSTQCPGGTSELPYDGIEWSRIDILDAAFPTNFTNGGTSLTATAHLSLYGAITPAGRFTTPGRPEVHLYQTRSDSAGYNQSSYGGNTPYVLTNAYFDIFGMTIKNGASSQPIVTVAVAQPGPFSGPNSFNNVAVDANSNTNWRLLIGGQSDGNPNGTNCKNLSPEYFCWVANGTHTIPAGGSETLYVDENVPPQNYGYTDWLAQSVNPNFSIAADGTGTVVANSPTLTVDTLAFAQYALDSTQMAASFSPSTAGTNSSPNEGLQVTNESTASDPNPDYVDAIVFGVPNGNPAVTGTPTTTTSGWSYLGSYAGGATTYYWFGVCPSQYVNANTYLPPAATPNTAVQNALPQCTNAQEANSLAPGATFDGSIQFSNIAATANIQMWAHGANDNGWTAPRAMTLPVSSLSASAGFTAAGTYGAPPAVAKDQIATVGGSSNPTYGNSYTYTVTNTSNSTGITSFRIRVPGTDISGNNAYDGTNAWHITNAVPTVSGGDGLCTVTNALAAEAATAGGADGEIDVAGLGCNIAAGQTLTLKWSAINPQSQNDQYQFTTYCLNNTAATCTLTNGTNAGENWLGDTRVLVQLQIGLDVVVAPLSNPGPGSSTPLTACGGCAFSGSTIDVGTVGSNSTAAFTDVVRASVYITSATTVTYTLSVQTSNNPVNSTGSPSNELLTEDDQANSSPGAGINFDQTSYAVVPTASWLQIAHGTSVTTRTAPYDMIENFEVAIGNESIMPQSSTVTYQLIAN